MRTTRKSITPHLEVDEVVRIYEESAASIREGFEAIAAAQSRLNSTIALDGVCKIYVRDRWRQPYRWDDVESVLVELRRDVWQAIIERLELRRIMSIKRAKELDAQIENGELPEITVDNVSKLALEFRNSIDTMLEEAVEEVFDWLRPRRSDYKTNTEFEVGKRVILPYVVELTYPRARLFRVRYTYDQHLVALENVFSMLAGEGGVSKSYRSKLYDAISEAEGGRGETKFFRFRCCKNMNLHLEFKDMSLVKRLNQIAGGRRLKPQEKKS